MGGDAVLEWYRHEIVAPGRHLLFLATVAFVFTFVGTRIITRMIRSGRGPFGNVSAGDLHIHHVVPGVISLLVGGVLLLSASKFGPWLEIGAILFGLGAALVLDEFALILHLDDVYWKREGALSVDAITVALAVMTCALIVSAPENPPGPDRTDPHMRILGPALYVGLWLIPVAITVFKGRLFLAALAVLNPVFGWWGAVRLARPRSPWAALRYADKPTKKARAQARADRFDRRVAPLRHWWSENIFGLETGDSQHAAPDASDAPPPEGVSVESGGPAAPPGRSN